MERQADMHRGRLHGFFLRAVQLFMRLPSCISIFPAHLGSPESLEGQLLSFWGGTGQQSYQTFVHLILVLGVTMDQRIQENLHFFLGLF